MTPQPMMKQIRKPMPLPSQTCIPINADRLQIGISLGRVGLAKAHVSAQLFVSREILIGP